MFLDREVCAAHASDAGQISGHVLLEELEPDGAVRFAPVVERLEVLVRRANVDVAAKQGGEQRVRPGGLVHRSVRVGQRGIANKPDVDDASGNAHRAAVERQEK